MKKIDELKDKIERFLDNRERKALIAKLKRMSDDELEQYVMKQIKKDSKDAKKTVVTAIQTMDEPEKQLELTVQISDELTKTERSKIIESIDESAILFDDNGIDIIKGLDKGQKVDIVERIISNQELKVRTMPLEEIPEVIDQMHYLINEAKDSSVLNYIYTVRRRLESEKDNSSERKNVESQIKLKLIRLAAKKILCNYKNIGYSMQIREFMKQTIPENIPDEKKREIFFDAIELEGNKLGIKDSKNKIAELLKGEEERYRQGEIKKKERDSGKASLNAKKGHQFPEEK